MSRKVFVDSDVIFDFLTEREPHNLFAKRLFSMIDRGEIQGFTSPLIFANLYYLLRKQSGHQAAKTWLRKMKLLFNLLPIDGKVVDAALDSPMSDFEDALQSHCARAGGMDILITRNRKDYKESPIPHMTAEEFLGTFV